MNDDWCTKSPTMWFDLRGIYRELSNLKFAVAALAETCGDQGSFKREMAMNASSGIKERIDYLHDSIVRISEKGK